MKKLLIPLLLAFMMTPPPAHAGYFAFHADVVGHIGDILGDYGRPDSDDGDDCDIHGEDCPSTDPTNLPPVVPNLDAWINDVLAALGL